MTIGFGALLLYAAGLLALFLTPGPVWFAVIARGLSGGFNAVWPLALGVAVGDVFWPLAAILGLGFITEAYPFALDILRYVGSAIFVILGVLLLRNPDVSVTENKTLTKPGLWAGFIAGLLAILGNPKAIVFYSSILPAFFNFEKLNRYDILVICVISAIIPLFGNLTMAAFLEGMRHLIKSPEKLRKLNLIAAWLLIIIGISLLFF